MIAAPAIATPRFSTIVSTRPPELRTAPEACSPPPSRRRDRIARTPAEPVDGGLPPAAPRPPATHPRLRASPVSLGGCGDPSIGHRESLCAHRDLLCTERETLSAIDVLLCAIDRSLSARRDLLCPERKTLSAIDRLLCAIDRSPSARRDLLCPGRETLSAIDRLLCMERKTPPATDHPLRPPTNRSPPDGNLPRVADLRSRAGERRSHARRDRRCATRDCLRATEAPLSGASPRSGSVERLAGNRLHATRRTDGSRLQWPRRPQKRAGGQKPPSAGSIGTPGKKICAVLVWAATCVASTGVVGRGAKPGLTPETEPA